MKGEAAFLEIQVRNNINNEMTIVKKKLVKEGVFKDLKS